jgi:hypothetical protein
MRCMNSTESYKQKMNKIYIITVLLFLLSLSGAISCNAGRSGCIASCVVQNCATGYCNSNDVCVCSRCGIGSSHVFSRS